MKPEDKEEYKVVVCQKCWHLKHYREFFSLKHSERWTSSHDFTGSVLCDDCWREDHASDVIWAQEKMAARDKTQ